MSRVRVEVLCSVNSNHNHTYNLNHNSNPNLGRLSETERNWLVFETSDLRLVGDVTLNPSLRKSKRE